jgi:CheY-like chemotaxis protein
LTIAIEDSGVGIEARDLERIFQNFTQVRTISQGASEGAGLGLSIARWVAERLGGSLTVRSEPGRGSTFTIDVPLETPPAVQWVEPSEIPESSVLEDAQPAAKIRLEGRVLLADDAADARQMMENALGGAGAEVVSAADGMHALNAVRSPNEFDLILLDLRMPNMDGEQAVAELRRRGCRCAIIALTAHVATADRAPILEAGFDDVWSKPISLEHLVQRAAAYLPTAAPGEKEDPSAAAARAARFAEIKATFLNSLPMRMQVVRSSVRSADRDTAEDELHRLFGSAGTCGFMEISSAAEKVLSAVTEGRLQDAPAALEKLEQAVAAAQVS